MLTFLAPSNLCHGNRFGNLGLHSTANSLFGWQSRIYVGHPIDQLKLATIVDILHLFSEASGLHNNVQKSNVYPICCDESDIAVVQGLLSCGISSFPCKYLGLPLTLRKITKEQTQPIIDKFANQLPGWKADLMTRAGRTVQVWFVLTGMLIYLAMAIELPTYITKAIDKIRRGFL
jgi:hypothetical protein